MSLYGSLLGIGGGSLASHQNRMAIIYNNIANASTPGYRRQRVEMMPLDGYLQDGNASGVTVGRHRSIEAPLIDRQLAFQRGGFGYNQTIAEIGAIAEASFNPIDGLNLNVRLGDLFNSMSSLLARPSGSVERRDMLTKASSLATGFNMASRSLSQTRTETQARATDLIVDLNRRLDQIASLEEAIALATASGDHPGGLVDTRDQLIAEVSEDISVRIVPADNGKVHLVTQDGLALVEDGRARHLEISFDGTSNELEVGLTGGAGPTRPLSTIGGNLGGLVHSHNDVLGNQLRELDQLAYEFSEAFNSIHRGGVGLSGVAGSDFFTPVGAVNGAARRLEVDGAILADPDLIAATTDPAELPGGNDNIQALLALQDEILPSGYTPESAILAMNQELGNVIRSAMDEAELSSMGIAHLQNLQAAVSGVSLEEEMLMLTETQRAMEAAMKLIQVEDEMLETILSLR